MNLDVNGMGEAAGDGRAAGGREFMGVGEAIAIHKLHFRNLHLVNKS